MNRRRTRIGANERRTFLSDHIALTIAAFMSCAATAQGLTQFNNGAVADADELNANFSALEERIDSLRSSYEAVVVANGFTPIAITRIDHTALLNLCGDESGCTVRLCRAFADDPGFEFADVPECQGLRHVAYDEATGR